MATWHRARGTGRRAQVPLAVVHQKADARRNHRRKASRTGDAAGGQGEEGKQKKRQADLFAEFHVLSKQDYNGCCFLHNRSFIGYSCTPRRFQKASGGLPIVNILTGTLSGCMYSNSGHFQQEGLGLELVAAAQEVYKYGPFFFFQLFQGDAQKYLVLLPFLPLLQPADDELRGI